jgi:hypothetical protein
MNNVPNYRNDHTYIDVTSESSSSSVNKHRFSLQYYYLLQIRVTIGQNRMYFDNL